MTVAAFLLAGIVCLVLAAALIHPIAGLAALGVALLFLAWASMPSKE